MFSYLKKLYFMKIQNKKRLHDFENVQNENVLTNVFDENCFYEMQIQSNKDRKNHTKNIRAVFYIIVLGGLLFLHTMLFQTAAVYADASSISESVLRFRVIANSDSENDQETKLIFKTRFCQEVKPYLSECNSLEECLTWIQEHMNQIQQEADAIAKELSIDSCQVSLTDSFFPTRTYGNLTFPPGEYQTLLIKLGEGKGENWWCVLYPSLCFTDESTAIFPEQAQEQLQEVLPEEEYEVLEEGVSYRFKIAEVMGRLYQKLMAQE